MHCDAVTAIQDVDHRRAVDAGDHLLHGIERTPRDVRHQISLAARSHHGIECHDERVQRLPAVALERGVASRHELGARGQQRPDLPQSVDLESRAGRCDVDDDIGDAEQRRDFRGARDRHYLDTLAPCLEELARDVGKRGRDAHFGGDAVDRPHRTVIARGGHESTFTEAEIEATLDGASRFTDQVPAGDPDIGDAVGDELRNVLSADE